MTLKTDFNECNGVVSIVVPLTPPKQQRRGPMKCPVETTTGRKQTPETTSTCPPRTKRENKHELLRHDPLQPQVLMGEKQDLAMRVVNYAS
eukprot:jgi/Phyca11/508872/fgenesh2_kg.PHYCAscaffold_39_\